MNATTERDYLAELSSAVACYLRILAAVGDCLGQACPETGPAYRKRMAQLRSRLSFQPTRETIQESVETVEAELKDYATVAARDRDQRDLDLRRAIFRVEDLIEAMALRRDCHESRLRELAVRMETNDPADHTRNTQTAADLRRFVEGMSDETKSMLDRLREEMATVEERLRGDQSTDPSTGLLNLREMTRQIEAYRAGGLSFSLLRFELRGPIGEQVMRQAAAKLEKQFRHRDRIARWGEREFLVLFLGPPEIAESRTAQVVRSLEARYDLESGACVEITVQAHLTHQELALV
jgi:GGDEF domain-containing protein